MTLREALPKRPTFQDLLPLEIEESIEADQVAASQFPRRPLSGFFPLSFPLGESSDGDRTNDLSRIGLKYLLSIISPTADLPVEQQP